MKKIVFLLIGLLTHLSYANQPPVILKLDDVSVLHGKCSCLPTMQLLQKHNIHASWGIVSQLCDSTAGKTLKPFIQVKDTEGNPLFEFWHHGYDHILPEFKGTDYDYQKKHFENADADILAYTGIQMNTFGAPFNQTDSITAIVIKENPQYTHIFFCDEKMFGNNKKITVLNNRINIENGTGKIEYPYFVDNYNKAAISQMDYIVLQGHPNRWDSSRREELLKIINFLQQKGHHFILPSSIR